MHIFNMYMYVCNLHNVFMCTCMPYMHVHVHVQISTVHYVSLCVHVYL